MSFISNVRRIKLNIAIFNNKTAEAMTSKYSSMTMIFYFLNIFKFTSLKKYNFKC